MHFFSREEREQYVSSLRSQGKTTKEIACIMGVIERRINTIERRAKRTEKESKKGDV